MSWGQTVISTFSMPNDNPTPAWGGDYENGKIGDDGYSLGDNGGVSYFAQGLKDKNDENQTRNFVKRDNGYKLQSDDVETAHFKLQFAAGHVKPGDILTIGANQVYNTAGDIKFKVGGSNVVETGTYVANGSLVEINHTIQASEIIKDGDNEYIRIGRCSYPDNSIGFATFKITRPAGFIVTVGMKGASATGCDAWFTLGDDATQYRGSRTGVAEGTKVVFHASDSGSGAEHVVMNGWRDAGTSGDTGWHNWGSESTVNSISSDLNYEAEFWSAFRVFANAENGATARVYTNTSTKENVSGKKYHDKVDGLYFETSVPDGYTFLGWDDGSGIKSSANPWSKGTHQPGNGIDDLIITAKFKSTTHPANIDCINNTIDLSKITVGWGGATYDPTTHQGSITSNYGEITVKFASAIDLHELNTLTLAGTNVIKTADAGAFNGITYVCEGGNVSDYNYPFASTLSDTDKEKLKKVTEIKFVGGEIDAHKGNFTLTSITLNFGGEHAAKTTPALNNGTTADMKVIEGESVTLSATNGYWREFTDNTYTSVKSGLIPNDRYNPQAPFDGTTLNKLAKGHYYFAIEDATWCTTFNHKHASELVKIHVEVVDPIATVDVNGTTRQYDVYAPEGISGNVGVVISLHRKDYDYYVGRTDFNPIADLEKDNNDKKFVVVYPRALVRDGHRTWQLDESSTDDIDFFRAIVKKINDDANSLTVDNSRIYLAGYSDGGAMAFKVAHKDADFYSAIASVSGVPYDDSHLWHAGKKPVPFLFIQGAEDGIFRDQIGTTNVTTIAHNMMYRNGAAFAATNGTLEIKGTNNNIVYDCHEAQEGGAAFYHYTIPGMHHQSDFDWDGTAGDDVAPTMWAFFNKADKVNSVDNTLKFRVNDSSNFWANAGNYGFVKGAAGSKDVLTYGGSTKTNENKNIYHSLQFAGTGGGTPHYLRLNMETPTVANSTEYFLVSLFKNGDANPVFAKRYQAGKGAKDLYINFTATTGVNEYRLVVTKSSESLDVKVNRVEFHSGMCEDNPGVVENDVYFTDIRTLLGLSDVPAERKLNPIYQPVYGQSYNGLAKEYLPIATITVPTVEKVEEDPNRDTRTLHDVLRYTNNGQSQPTTITSIAGSTTTDASEKKLYVNMANSPKDTNNSSIKGKNVVILGNETDNAYPIDNTDGKGINISHYGRAMMPEYINGTRGDFPSHGVMAMQIEGTLDFTVLATNVNTTAANRRVLRVYYTNDQLNSEIRELKDWDFYGTRNEDGTSYGQQLDCSIRMQHLGQDGTCVVFVTYEGRKENNVLNDYNDDHDDVWIKGIVIKRPDLKVTIGRTDGYGCNENGTNTTGYNENVNVTPFGKGKPYQWNLGTASFNNTKKADIDKKKYNQHDGRTYICGVGPNGEQLKDHLLVYSEADGDVVAFDGRPSNGKHAGYEDDETDNNEHIEFTHPTKYATNFSTNRRETFPVVSNALKVNVTGSGWFTIACSAPEGPVKMKVLSSTNGGNAFVNVLREFTVDTRNLSNPETNWQVYRVYLKAHLEKNGTEGFWDGTDNANDDHDDPEQTQMSLYIVYEGAENSQLNIHYLQWINEMPADYVFQREENPALLNSLQSITSEEEYTTPSLYWQAGTSKTEGKKSSTSKTTDYADSAYDSADQDERENGQDSGWGTISRELDCQWNVAAKALTKGHSEKAYANGSTAFNDDNVYSLAQANGTESNRKLEFALPMSGSFLRFMPMKNEFISAFIVPENETAANIYVLDETGKPIPFCKGADMNGESNKAKITQEARERGWVHAAAGMNPEDENDYKTNPYFTTKDGTTAVRIDFAALAGKEYFICSDNATISLARLKVTENAWRAAVEEVDAALTLENDADGATNTAAINASMNGTGRYLSESKPVTLNRAFTAGTWASLILPFSMNEKKFEEVFGEGAQCVHFTDLDTHRNVVKLTHHFYNMIVAGRPVFVKPTVDVASGKTISDVTLQTNSVVPTTTSHDGCTFTFTGSYDNSNMASGATESDDKCALFISSNEFKYTKKQKSIKALRTWIDTVGWDPVPVSTSTNAPVMMMLNFDDEDVENATSIESLVAEEYGQNVIVVTKSTKVYDINGRVVANGTDISNLPSGVYIVNGKKYVK